MSQVFYKEGLSPKEILEQKKLQKQYIKAEIEQNMRDMERVKRFKDTQGNIQNVTKFEKPLSERIKDRNLQLTEAQTLLNSIFEDNDEALKVLQSLTDMEIQKLNRYGPAIRSNILDQFENIDADFFLDYIKNYIQKQEQSKNLLNFFYPVNIEEIKEFRKMGGDANVKPFKGRLGDSLINDLTVNFDSSNLERNGENFNKLKSIRKKIENDILKISNKSNKTPADADKLLKFDDWLVKIEETLNRIEQVGATFKTGTFDDELVRQMREEIRLQEQEQGPDEVLMRPNYQPREEEFFDPEGELNMTPEQLQAIADQEQIDREEALLSRGRGILKSGLMKRGQNLTFKAGRRPIVGRGLFIESPKEQFVPFGKYILNIPQLEDGYLLMKYPSKGPVNVEGLGKKMKISDNMKIFLMDTIEKKKVSNAKFNNLTNEEKTLIKKIFELAKLNKFLQIKEGKGIMEDEDMKKYHVILGEIKAGNTNKDLKRQLILLLSKFVLEGRIRKEEGEEIIKDLLE
jgi:hypothetical protein